MTMYENYRNYILIRLPKQTNEYLRTKYKHKQIKRFQRGDTRFSSAAKFRLQGLSLYSPKKQWRRQLVGTWTRAPPWRLRIFFAIR